MANKKQDSNEERELIVNSEVTVDSEKEELKNRVSELEKMLRDFLQSQQKQQSDSSEKEQPKTKKSLFYDIEDELQISPHAQIRIMSLVIGGLNLRGIHNIIYIPDFGNVRTVAFEDLREITNNHPDLAREGAFIILNEKAVKALYLDNDYEKLLGRSDIEQIVNLDPSQIHNVLKNATKVQLQSIAALFIREIPKGDSRYLDRNKLQIVSDFVGTDIYLLAMEVNTMEKMK